MARGLNNDFLAVVGGEVDRLSCWRSDSLTSCPRFTMPLE